MDNNTISRNKDYLFMIEQAVKAPSGHNSQPWRFKMKTHTIEIHPDADKALPVVDPDNREMFISLGCAAENLCIAARAKGYVPQVSLLSGNIISIELTKPGTEYEDDDMAMISRRQANRSIYNGKIIPEKLMKVLTGITLEQGIRLHHWNKTSALYKTLSNFVAEGNNVQMSDPAFLTELKLWMRFNKKQAAQNNGLSYAVFGAPNLPLFISKPVMNSFLNPKMQNKSDRKKIESSSHFVLFTTPNNTIDEWVGLGLSLQRFLLKLTAYGIAHAYCNQPCEVPRLAAQLQQIPAIDNGYPAVLLRIGYGKPMPYSKRQNIIDVIF